jgi:hypothetical protein
MEPQHAYERTLVSSVEVEADESTRTHPHCWVEIRPLEQLVDVWLKEESVSPDLTLPLASVRIQWRALPRRLGLQDG